MIAVNSGDGYLRIRNVKSCDLIKEFCCVPRTNSFKNAKLLCRIDFHPVTAQYFDYPENNSVVLLDTSTWSKERTLSATENNAFFQLFNFLPAGNFWQQLLIMVILSYGPLQMWN